MMSASALIMMVVGIVIIWCGLVASIVNAVNKAKSKHIWEKIVYKNLQKQIKKEFLQVFFLIQYNGMVSRFILHSFPFHQVWIGIEGKFIYSIIFVHAVKIGRASCRERVSGEEVGVAVQGMWVDR